MTKFYGAYQRIMELERKITELESQYDLMADEYNQPFSYEVIEKLYDQLDALKAVRNGGLVCRCW